MRIRVWTDRGRDAKPKADVTGLPVRVTTFQRATRSSAAEAVIVIVRGSMRSVVSRAGEQDLYLSPRAQFKVIESDLAKAEGGDK